MRIVCLLALTLGLADIAAAAPNDNRVKWLIPMTRNHAVWFDARTGRGTVQINCFPDRPASGFDNPFLPAPNGRAAYRKGLLACWAVRLDQHLKWNHLSGTATVHHPTLGAYEYNAYAFAVPIGLDLERPGPLPGIRAHEPGATNGQIVYRLAATADRVGGAAEADHEDGRRNVGDARRECGGLHDRGVELIMRCTAYA